MEIHNMLPFGIMFPFMDAIFSGKSAEACAIYNSSSGNHKPSLVRLLCKFCGNRDKEVSLAAASALLTISEEFRPALRIQFLGELASLETIGHSTEANSLRKMAQEKLERCNGILMRQKTIEGRCDAIAMLERESRDPQMQLRTRASTILINFSCDLPPEFRKDVLERLLLRNLPEPEYHGIAGQAAQAIVSFCREGAGCLPGEEALARISDALGFFAGLSPSNLFPGQVAGLEKLRISIQACLLSQRNTLPMGCAKIHPLPSHTGCEKSLQLPPPKTRRRPSTRKFPRDNPVQKIRGPQQIAPKRPLVNIYRTC